LNGPIQQISAREATDQAARDDYLEIARSWRHLAESYAETLDRFILDVKRAKKRKPKPPYWRA
jgi:hypothetical protein